MPHETYLRYKRRVVATPREQAIHLSKPTHVSHQQPTVHLVGLTDVPLVQQARTDLGGPYSSPGPSSGATCAGCERPRDSLPLSLSLIPYADWSYVLRNLTGHAQSLSTSHSISVIPSFRTLSLVFVVTTWGRGRALDRLGVVACQRQVLMRHGDNTSSQTSVFGGRGMFSETAGPYNFAGADHFLGILETESPHYQPSPVPQARFSINSAYKDLTFLPTPGGRLASVHPKIDQPTALRRRLLQVFLVSFVGDTCVSLAKYQDAIVNIDSVSTGINTPGLSTVGVTNMLNADNTAMIPSSANRFVRLKLQLLLELTCMWAKASILQANAT
ncbi:hypothetical protein BKA62DRAFT_769779 [Auriculariales sp. MPI-PUGE-AT-0066]|nr:hypothetical protein BKA62DRAFT_769779 [Auriculariales sp. MPI-PUGE-AT-0066]